MGIIVCKTHNAAFTPKKAANLFACSGIWLFERAATNNQIPDQTNKSPTYSTFGASILYKTGVTTRDKSVEEIRPPINT
jgi:hypothetical protein